jgi:hypothetical protein
VCMQQQRERCGGVSKSRNTEVPGRRDRGHGDGRARFPGPKASPDTGVAATVGTVPRHDGGVNLAAVEVPDGAVPGHSDGVDTARVAAVGEAPVWTRWWWRWRGRKILQPIDVSPKPSG